MEATDNSRSQAEAFRRFAGTRRGAITIAIVAAALAAIVLIAFAARYKDSVQGGNAQRTGAGRRQLRTLMADVLVLSAPGTDASGKPTSGSSSNLTLRVGASDAAKLAFASDNGKIWVVLRPPTGGTNPSASPVTLESL